MDFTNMIENTINTNRLPVIKRQDGLYYNCINCVVNSYSTDEDTGTVILIFTLASWNELTVEGTFDPSNEAVLDWIRSNKQTIIA